MSIPSHILDQLNSQADLVSIIGRHTTLKRSSNEFKGCCPFHGEKTPSFYVNPQKNIYHCFGCGVAGNAISFLRDYENLTFLEAVKELSRQTGIEIPKEDTKAVKYQRGPMPSAAAAPSTPSKAVNSKAVNSNSSVNSNSNSNAVEGSQQTNPALTPSLQSHSTVNRSQSVSTSFDDWQSSADIAPPQYDDSNDIYPDDFAPIIGNDIGNNNGSGGHSIAHAPTQEGNLYELLEQIQTFYQQSLTHNAAAKHYFLSRGLSDCGWQDG